MKDYNSRRPSCISENEPTIFMQFAKSKGEGNAEIESVTTD